MHILSDFVAHLTNFLPTLAVILLVLLSLFLVNKALSWHWRHQSNMRFRFQITMLIVTLIAVIIVVISLPISDALRAQLLSLMGILLSAAIALSSTTFIGNMLAGIMLKIIGCTKPGDFITVAEVVGRVTEMGLLHTEVQTEDRDLVTIPNVHIVTNPVKVVRSSGTIVSAEVSLGYDVSNSKVKDILAVAAQNAGLNDPFVQIRELGDFSIVYRVAGLLVDVKSLISSRSNLRECMLEELHRAGIEIVSPSFMNSRVLKDHQRFIAKPTGKKRQQHEGAVEDLAFDKADHAASIEGLRYHIEQLEEQISAMDQQARIDEASVYKALMDEKAGLLLRLAEEETIVTQPEQSTNTVEGKKQL